ISGPTPAMKRTGSWREGIRGMLARPRGGALPGETITGILRRSFRTQEDFMSRACDICGKGVQHGQNVSHAHNVTKRRWEVNLQTVRALVDGKPRKLRVCTRCIRSGAVQKKMPQSVARSARTL